MAGYDTMSLVQAAWQSVEQEYYDYALQVLGQIGPSGKNVSYYQVKVKALIGLHMKRYCQYVDDHYLVLAKNEVSQALEKEQQRAGSKTGTKTELELKLLLCEVMELEGDFETTCESYNSFFIDFPRYKKMLNIKFKAVQALRRVNLIEDGLSYMQEILDDPIEPYDEIDVAMMMGLLYENSRQKKHAKEAFKQAYKKSREAGRVKFIENGHQGRDGESAAVFVDGFPMNQDRQTKQKHVPYSEWREDPDTWVELGERCRVNGDYIFAIDFFTKALWTDQGQGDSNLWMKFAELSFILRDYDSALQALGTVYNMLPFDLTIRTQLGVWDPNNWGAHNAFEDQTITKMQSIIRGNWGRRKAAIHKKKVLAERARRNAAALTIQRTVARGTAGRMKAQRRRDQIAAEKAAYERWILETKSSVILQCAWRSYFARKELARHRIEFHSARVIQCSYRSHLARLERARLKRMYIAKMKRIGATHMQRIIRGKLGRKRASHRKQCLLGATHLQRVFRGYKARQQFYIDIAKYRGANQMQRIFRGYKKRMWYRNLRFRSAQLIQKTFRGYVTRIAFKPYIKAVIRYNHYQKSERTRFHQHMKTLNLFIEDYAEKTQIQMPEPKSKTTTTNNNNNNNKKNEQSSKVMKCSSSPSCKDDSEVKNTMEEETKDEDGEQNPRPNSAPCLTQTAATATPKAKEEDEKKKKAISILVAPQVLIAPGNMEVEHGEINQRCNPKPVLNWLQSNPREAQSLWLSDFRLGPKGAKQLGILLQKNESLRELGLGRGTDIGYEGSFSIAEAMRCHNFRITKLFVNDQPELGDQGIMPFVKTIGDFFFGRYAKLEEVSLKRTGLGDRSCVILSEGLALNDKLRSLQLEDNRIGDEGACALATIFERNETLLELNLNGNRIQSGGASALVKSLQDSIHANALEVLRLDANYIQTHGGVAISKCLLVYQRQRREIYITITANPMHPKISSRIKELATKLPTFAQRGGLTLEAYRASHNQPKSVLLSQYDHHHHPHTNGEPHEKKPLELNIIGPPFPKPSVSPPHHHQSSSLLPPVKVIPGKQQLVISTSKMSSPYLSVPWSPNPLSPESPKSPPVIPYAIK